MARRIALMAIAVGWVVLGLLGVVRYVSDYNQTRGFPRLERAAGARAGKLMWVHFHSEALRKQAGYIVYLPGGYTPTHRYPVLYLLHGMPGVPQLFIKAANVDVRVDNLTREGRMPAMIVVFPDGRINGQSNSDSEWANTPTGNYESFVIDIVHDVDARFSSIPSRTGRVIAGYSAGGFGALNISMHHLDVFGSAEAWSGPFAETPTGVFAHATQAQISHYSPLAYAASLRSQVVKYPFSAFVYAGRADPDSRYVAPLIAELRRSGITASGGVYPGGHDWQLWNAHLTQMLVLAGAQVRPALTGHVPPAPRPGSVSAHTPAARPHASARPASVGRLLSSPHARRRASSGSPTSKTIAGLVLALISATLINLGFLIQHRSLSAMTGHDGSGSIRMLRASIRDPMWLGGQVTGWAGFAVQIAAVALAPLALVQAFAAGGLVLSVPLASGIFGYPITRRQATAIVAIAIALGVLGVGIVPGHEHYAPLALGVGVVVALGLGSSLALARNPSADAVAAGVFYGVADASIKATTLSVHAGQPYRAGVWALLAGLGTFLGFIAFQRALRHGHAVNGISLMTATATLAGVVFGVGLFGEHLGSDPATSAVAVAAIAVVLACVPALVAAQTSMADGVRAGRVRRRRERALTRA